MFDLDGKDDYISTNPNNPELTSLTYQSITMPKRGGEQLDQVAIELWSESLISNGEAVDEESAIAWIEDLENKNSNYYKERLSIYRKKVRDDFSKHGNALWTLYESSRKTLEMLKEIGSA